MAGTLRLTNQEKEALERLKMVTKQKTDSGAIKHAILYYVELEKRFEKEQIKLKQTESLYFDLKCKVRAFFSANEDLKKIIDKDK